MRKYHDLFRTWSLETFFSSFSTSDQSDLLYWYVIILAVTLVRNLHDLPKLLLLSSLQFTCLFQIDWERQEFLLIIAHFSMLIVTVYLFDMRVCAQRIDNRAKMKWWSMCHRHTSTKIKCRHDQIHATIKKNNIHYTKRRMIVIWKVVTWCRRKSEMKVDEDIGGREGEEERQRERGRRREKRKITDSLVIYKQGWH